MVWMGTVTKTFLPPVGATNAAILEQTLINAEFHVENRTPKEVANAR
jgi:hypothetical protein